MKEGSGNSASLSEVETGGRAPLLGTPKFMPIKALEMGVCFHGGPILENMGVGSFIGPSREGRNLFILRELLLRNLRYM